MKDFAMTVMKQIKNSVTMYLPGVLVLPGFCAANDPAQVRPATVATIRLDRCLTWQEAEGQELEVVPEVELVYSCTRWSIGTRSFQ